MSIRAAMREAQGRKVLIIIFLALSFIASLLVVTCTNFVNEYQEVIRNWLKGIGTFVAILSVTSYNLRCRNIDYMLKVASTIGPVDKWGQRAQNTGERLTNIIILSFGTSLVVFLNAILTSDWWFSAIFTISCATFVVCIVEYIYVLMAFEGLEHFIITLEMDNIKKDRKQAAQKEEDKINKEFDDRYSNID